MSVEDASDFCSQLSHWRKSTPSHDPKDYYPKDILNLHIEVCNEAVEKRIDGSIDYHEKYTNFTMYNYRIGNMFTPAIQKHIPIIKKIGPKILDLFYSVLRQPELVHGSQSGKNLYIEVTHFPCGSGFIEEHTHETILEYGQPVNMIIALSKKGFNFDTGGLFVRQKSEVIDLSEQFDVGDVVFLRNDTPHWVSPVLGGSSFQNGEDGGRWSMTMFYY